MLTAASSDESTVDTAASGFDRSDHTPKFESVKGAKEIYLGDTGLFEWDAKIDTSTGGSNMGRT